jgi:hypothetical protein
LTFGENPQDHPGPCANARAVTSVQQPCSNPSKSPERLRKTPTQKCSDFQQFCKIWKPVETYLAALAWRRSRVRVSSGPLRESRFLQSKLTRSKKTTFQVVTIPSRRRARSATILFTLLGKLRGCWETSATSLVFLHIRAHFSRMDPFGSCALLESIVSVQVEGVGGGT